MSDFDDSVMVALLPSTATWCRIELPHLTMVYAGEIKDIKPTVRNEITKEAFSIAHTFGPLAAPVVRVGELGEADELVDALILEPTEELTRIRNLLKFWDRGKHPGFLPHATVGPQGAIVGLTVPHSLSFNKIAVSWGKERTEFVLMGPGAPPATLGR